MIDLGEIGRLKNKLIYDKPLIHGITHPIGINQCANIILASGAKAIMAQHPEEVAEITRSSKALYLSLGNIDPSRVEAMKISLQTANEVKIPILLDMVGVGVSKLRYDFAKDLLEKSKVSLVKGNMSEIKTMLGPGAKALGVDVGEEDRIDRNIKEAINLVKELAQKYKATVFATGAIDIVSDGTHTFLCYNGHESMADITATGCMLAALTTALMSETSPFYAAAYSSILMGVLGEEAFEKGHIYYDLYKFILDGIYYLDEELIREKARFEADI